MEEVSTPGLCSFEHEPDWCVDGRADQYGTGTGGVLWRATPGLNSPRNTNPERVLRFVERVCPTTLIAPTGTQLSNLAPLAHWRADLEKLEDTSGWLSRIGTEMHFTCIPSSNSTDRFIADNGTTARMVVP